MSSTLGPPAWLLLRGLGRATRHWFDFPSRLSGRLHASVLAVDLPGVGDVWQGPTPLSVPAMARDVERRLIDERLNAPFGIVAISLGSMVALSLAQQFPTKVERLVLINPSSRLSAPRARLRPLALFDLLRGTLTRAPVARERIFHALVSNATDVELKGWATRAAAISEQQPVRRRNLLKQLLAAARFTAPHVEQPTLILSARGDRMVSPSCSDDLARYLGARHAQHPRAGHDLPLEDAEWVIERMVEWLPASRLDDASTQPALNQRS